MKSLDAQRARPKGEPGKRVLVTPKLVARAWEGLVQTLPPQLIARACVYHHPQILARGQRVPLGLTMVELPADSLFVFVDEEPHRNWAHAARVVLCDPDTGESYRQVPVQFPPGGPTGETLLTPFPNQPSSVGPSVSASAAPVPPQRSARRRLKPLFPPPSSAGGEALLPAGGSGRRAALLFGGWVGKENVNEIEYLYRVLRDRYQYADEHIAIYSFSGGRDSVRAPGSGPPSVNWPGDLIPFRTPFRMPVRGPGTPTNLEDVFGLLAAKLEPADSLLLFITGHGYNYSGESWLACYDPVMPYSPTMYPASRIRSLIAALPPIRQLMVLLQQCNSGGFIPPILNGSQTPDTAVAAPCTESGTSYGGDQASPFGPFSKNWISAMNGFEPDGATALPGFGPGTTAGQAFNHALHGAQVSPVGDDPQQGYGSPMASSIDLL